ncbi:hypothetical protein [Nonomuraea mesophila]|uniref:hypothetical protein n=1 Tax=Nonomuraea mesophila TaxID=2530382 RepID=UPI00140849FB|nr:hypothetical protein [Nonomuraea mesophila]
MLPPQRVLLEREVLADAEVADLVHRGIRYGRRHEGHVNVAGGGLDGSAVKPGVSHPPVDCPFHRDLLLGVVTMRSQTPNARRRGPAHLDYAIGSPKCRARGEEHVTSMNSAISASQKALETAAYLKFNTSPR